jgi:adenylosuccinate lyase
MTNLSLPGNPRYQPKQLVPVFGYDNLYSCVAEVEIATLKTLAEIGVIPEANIAHLTPEVESQLLAITTSTVDEVERTVTKHDIRAWVNIAKEKVHPSLRRWIHIPLTSYDVLDTARMLQFKRAHEQVVLPLTSQLIEALIEKVEQYESTVQIGRTHGQHALPITVGFWLAGILHRVVTNTQDANNAVWMFPGKISGAVGAYNAQVGLGIEARCKDESFEALVLRKLDLYPAAISTQILPPEPLADYLFAIMKLSATFGQFGRDARHLMRTEIGELAEPFETGQVGSSTMAHKRNPINFENLEGTWLKNQVEFSKVMMTLISEHQRDLVGSCIARDFPTMVVNVVSQLNTLLRLGADGRPFIARIAIDEEAVNKNVRSAGDVILAEPIYIALQMAGFEGDAHHLVNHVALPHMQRYGGSLFDAVFDVALPGFFEVNVHEPDTPSDEIFGRLPEGFPELCEVPKSYIGHATKKARQVCEYASSYLTTVTQYTER